MVTVQRKLNGCDVGHGTWRTGPLTRANWQKDGMNGFHCRYIISGQVITWGCVCVCDVDSSDSSSCGAFSAEELSMITAAGCT